MPKKGLIDEKAAPQMSSSHYKIGLRNNFLYIYGNMVCTFRHTSVFILAFSAILFFSCSNVKPDDGIELAPDTTQTNITNTELNAQKVFNSIPARADITALISESKVEYNPDLLNNPDLASKYSLENSRALNLGVYGSDLSVAGVV